MIRALAAALLLTACAPMGPGMEPEPPAAASPAEAPAGNWLLPGTEWRLVEMNGAPVAARVTAMLTEDGRVVGQAPCNRFTAAYSGRWPDLSFAPVASTRMACPDLAVETAFFAALGAVDRAAIGDDGLSFTGPDGVALRFVRI